MQLWISKTLSSYLLWSIPSQINTISHTESLTVIIYKITAQYLKSLLHWLNNVFKAGREVYFAFESTIWSGSIYSNSRIYMTLAVLEPRSIVHCNIHQSEASCFSQLELNYLIHQPASISEAILAKQCLVSIYNMVLRSTFIFLTPQIILIRRWQAKYF